MKIFLIIICLFIVGNLFSKDKSFIQNGNDATYLRYLLDDPISLNLLMVNSNLDTLENSKSDQPNELITIFKQKKYKVFQPIDVLLKFTLNGKPDITFKFEYLRDIVNFEITDEDGLRYNFKEKPDNSYGIDPDIYYNLEFGDTITSLEVINEYGIKTKNLDSINFLKQNYFPPGYKGFVYTEDGKFMSNEFEFEISATENEDLEFLKLTMDKELIGNFMENENNDYYELLHREKVRQQLIKYNKGELPLDQIIDAYKNYMNLFPDSYYNVYYIPNYLRYKKQLTNETSSVLIEDLHRSFPNTFIEEYVRNNTTKELILRMLSD